MNIQIISNPRNGSTYMQRMICHHLKNLNDNYTCMNEPFLISPEVVNKEDIISFFNKQLDFIEINKPIITKSHITQIFDLQEYGAIQRYYDTKYYNILILRKDIFESALSLAIADIKNEFVEYKNFDAITIPHSVVIDNIDNQLWNLTYICSNKFNISYDEIVFMEDLTFDPVKDFFNMKLCNVPYENLRPFDISKLKAPSKKTIVTNYDHLKNVALEYLSRKKYDFSDFYETSLVNLKIKTQS